MEMEIQVKITMHPHRIIAIKSFMLPEVIFRIDAMGADYNCNQETAVVCVCFANDF